MAGAGARSGDLAPVGKDAEALLSLAVEEKREKVCKLWITNDREEKLLNPGEPMRTQVFVVFRSLTESWQN